MANTRLFALPILASFALSACSGTLPHAGPTLSAVENTQNLTITTVTPNLANSLNAIALNNDLRAQNEALMHLANENPSRDSILHNGDTLSITLWSISPFPGKSQSASSGPSPADLGKLTINAEGQINLPYAGRIHIAGLTPEGAQDRIAYAYRKGGVLQDPQVSLTLTNENSSGGILISGAIGSPKSIPWNPGGVDLGQALTSAMGNGATLYNNESSSNHNDESLSVDIHRGETVTSLSMDTALSHQIALQPGDRVVAHKASNITINVMSGGISKPGRYGYATTPSLASVIASAQGLNGNSANTEAVFILHRNPDNSVQAYQIPWNTGEGMIASQTFPVRNGDIVYVPEAGIVPVVRLTSIAMSLLAPAAMLRP